MINELISHNIKPVKYEMRLGNNAVIKYTKGREAGSFIVTDIMEFSDIDIIEIVSITSSIKGDGRKLLEIFCEQFKHYPIVLKAEPMYDTMEMYKKACKSGEFDKSLDKLIDYYNSCGFIDINFYVGYGCANGFIYGNKIGNKIYEHIKERNYVRS